MLFALALAAVVQMPKAQASSRQLFYSVGDSLTNNPHAAPMGRWPYLLGQAIGMQNVNLAAPGQNTAYVISKEIPQIAKGCTLVTVDTGANDWEKPSLAQMTPWNTYVDEMEGPYGVLASIRMRCPLATIVMLTDVNDYPVYDRRYEPFERMNAYTRELPQRWPGMFVADIAADNRFLLYPGLTYGPYMWNVLHENAAGQPLMVQDIQDLLLNELGLGKAR